MYVIVQSNYDQGAFDVLLVWLQFIAVQVHVGAEKVEKTMFWRIGGCSSQLSALRDVVCTRQAICAQPLVRQPVLAAGAQSLLSAE